MEVLKQWDNAAELFASEQEQSEFSQINKRVVKERFISLQCNLFTDMAGFSFAIFFHNFIFVV